MKNKKMIIAIVALVVVVAVFAGVYLATRPDTVAGGKTFTVTVVHKDESTKEFTYTTDAEFLGFYLEEQGLIEGERSDFGLYMSSVDGEVADYNVDSGYWALYIGEEYAMTGIDETPITDGAEFSLVYTIG